MNSLFWDDFFCNRVIGRSEYSDVDMEANTVYASYGLLKTVINEEKRDMRRKCKLIFILYASNFPSYVS
jgi:hypothetical protein